MYKVSDDFKITQYGVPINTKQWNGLPAIYSLSGTGNR